MKSVIHFRRREFAAACLALILSAAPAGAEELVIQAQSTKFAPLVLFAQPGDMIRWTTMAGHDSQSMENMIPEGAEHWHIQMGNNGSVTLEKEGMYVYKCNPHYALGMAGSIVVGEPSNLAEVEKHAKGMSKRVVIKTKKALENKLAAEKQDP